MPSESLKAAAYDWVKALMGPLSGPRQRFIETAGRDDISVQAPVDGLAAATRDRTTWAKAHPCPDPTLGRLADEMLETYRELAELMGRAVANQIPPGEQGAVMARMTELASGGARLEEQVQRWIDAAGD